MLSHRPSVCTCVLETVIDKKILIAYSNSTNNSDKYFEDKTWTDTSNQDQK